MADEKIIELGKDYVLPPSSSASTSLAPQPQEMKPATADTIPIDLSQPEGGYLARAGASIPTTTEGKVRFLERLYGKGNVFTTKDGDILFRQSAEGALTRFDERGLTGQDITSDLVGPAITMLPTLAAGSNPLTVGAAGVLGAGVRQVAAEALTGGTGMSATEIGKDLLTEGAIAGGGAAVFNVGARVFDALRPHNLIARFAGRSMSKPAAIEGQRLSTETGIPLTPGETSLSPSTLMVEAFARRTAGGAERFYDFHTARLQDAVNKITTIMDNVSPKALNSEEVGVKITKAFNDATEAAFSIRSHQGRIDFADVNRAARGQKIMPTDNIVAEIQKVIDQYDLPGAGGPTQKLVEEAKRMRDEFLAPAVDGASSGPAQRVSAARMQQYLAHYTDVMRGRASLFENAEKGQQKFIAERLKAAAEADVDAALRETGEVPQVAQTLRTARDNWRVNSETINMLADSVLSKVAENKMISSEAIAKKIAFDWPPSQVRQTMKILADASPEAAAAVRRHMIQIALDNAPPPISDAAESGVKFSAARFLKSMPDERKMVAAGFTPKDLKEIKDISGVLERVATKAYEGSPTEFAAITWDTIRGLFTLNPVKFGEGVGSLLMSHHIAKAITTPQGRTALLTLASARPGSVKAMAAFSSFIAIANAETSENVRPINVEDATPPPGTGSFTPSGVEYKVIP